MKKLITLLIVLLLWAESSWAFTVQIGSGTTTTSYFPIYSCYGYNYSQQIYLGSEISGGGGGAGTITKIRFYYNAGGTTYANWTSWTVYLGNTSKTTFTSTTDWVAVGSLTQVFSGNIPTPVAGTWLELTLSTSFSYTGGNLVVAVDENTAGYSCTAAWRSFESGSNRGILYYSDVTNPDPASPPAANYGPNASLAQIQLEMETGACTGTPAPGNTISSANPVCPNVNFTLSLQNSTPGTGVTYQWQTSATGADPWTNVGTSTPTYATSQTTATWYRCQVTCSGNTGTSAPLQVTMNPFLNCYCSSMASNTYDEEIYSVTVGGSTNAYDCFTVAPGTGSVLNQYSNFFPLGSLCNLPQSGIVPFTILEDECDGATYYSNGCAVWVDFNQDGDFTDAGEQVYSEAATTQSPRTITGNITVPAGATLGVTGMRITVAEDYYGATLTPCLAYGYGETEDYLVTITLPAACPQPTALDTSNVTTTSADLGWTPGGTETMWNVEVGSPGFTPGTNTQLLGVLGTQSNPWTASPLTPSTSYQFYVQADCGFSAPKSDRFWIAMGNSDTVPGYSGGAPVNDPGEDGKWYKYTTPERLWYNIWFYNGPLDLTHMKKIRMGFWIQRFNPNLPAVVNYVVNWSDSTWQGQGFPLPGNEPFVRRSPVNGPIPVTPGPQWIELYYIIPDYNPAWVSVDIWGQNIIILNEMNEPPEYSPLNYWWNQNPGPGGIIVHECLPKSSVSSWSGPKAFSTAVACPPPTALDTSNVTTTSADLSWTAGGTEDAWNVEVGLPGFSPGTNSQVLGVLGTQDNPWTASPLSPSTAYQFYVQADCGFSAPKNDRFWIAINNTYGLESPSGGTYDEDYEDGIWRQYATPERMWYNIWFYNGPLDTTHVKKIRMGFWVQTLDLQIPVGELYYVVNWSDSTWEGPGYPMPANESFVRRSPVNGPITIPPVDPGNPYGQWIELYYIIPDYNPEWVSVDIWGQNIIILNEMNEPPEYSPLNYWWNQNPGPGGIIVHECLPKYTVSSWSGPKAFTTDCGAVALPYCQYFPTTSFPACWTQGYAPAVTSNRWSVSATALAGGAVNEMHATWQNTIGESWLTSTELAVPAGGAVLTFKHFYDDYGAGLTLSVRYSNDGGLTWTTGWSLVSGGGDAGPETITVPITLSGNVIIQWYMNGNHYQFDNWYVDDVCVIAPLLHDAKTVSIDDVPALITPGTIITPKATVMNSGATSPETFNVTMTATGGYTSTVYGVTLNAGVQTQVTFAAWTPSLGDYTVTTCTQLTGDLDPTNDCKTKSVSVEVLTKFYAYNASGPGTIGPGYFYKEHPEVFFSLAATTSVNFICAGTWAGGTWYGSEYYNVTPATGGGWWTINETNGVMTKLADLGRSFTGITYDLTTHIMYGVDWDGSTNSLYTIVPATGVATLIGTFSAGELMINLATDGAGYLYSLGISTAHLFRINPVGPVSTDMGATGLALNYAQDMEYEHASNKMYAATYTTTGALYTVNLTTGACTLVGGFQGGAEMTGFAIPYCTENNQWTGNVSSDWSDPDNWTCGTVPDQDVNVFISSSPSGGRFPVIASGITAECFDIIIAPGADLIIQTGGTLNVANP